LRIRKHDSARISDMDLQLAHRTPLSLLAQPNCRRS
jgi:hypothetical protein